MRLEDLLATSARRTPAAVAVRTPDEQWTYQEVDAEAERLLRALRGRAVGPGERVAVLLEKGPVAVAAMQATLRAGGAYVPVDPMSPHSRIEKVLADCQPRVVVTTSELADAHRSSAAGDADWLCVNDAAAVEEWVRAHDSSADPAAQTVPTDPDALAFILYTSGSTGVPKGVCISHRNALAFVQWAAHEVRARPDDRFSNHAPFHFDLSVFDLYVAFMVGASVHIVPSVMAYTPATLVELIRRERITVWYSVPSAIVLMLREGGLLETPLPSLRALLFAGEPFPIAQLRAIYEAWDGVRLLNLYGPTETNVCTYHEVKDERDLEPPSVPIGRASSGDRAWAETADGAVAEPGQEGELVVDGPTVMLGYWGHEPQGDKPYRTGDWVEVVGDGCFRYLSRIDHMVKLRGHRIELGEVEAALSSHPAVDEGVALVVGEGIDKRLVAFLVLADGKDCSLIEMKRHCAERVPPYMIIEGMHRVAEMPRTGNGKVDRARLRELAGG